MSFLVSQMFPGTLMLIREHIDMLRDHSLRGPTDDRLGPRRRQIARGCNLPR